MLTKGAIVDGKYRVVRLVGEGGMGSVYEAQNVRLKRRVAIKVMHASMSADRLLVQRFEREAQAASKVGSSYVADVLDLGELPGGERYMVMEYLDGESLAARIKRRKRMTPQEIAPIAIQLLEGLSKVHEAGILHRDLKPGNIFITPAERGQEIVKILDFGICKMKKAKGELSTAVGNLLGTVGYLCPEQLEHGPKGLDQRADLYTVGVVVYRAVTGQLPYKAKNLVDLLHLMRQGKPSHVCELMPETDRAFGAIVDKAIEWDPNARYPTAKAFQKALVDWYAKYEDIDRILGDFLERVGESKVPPPRRGPLPAPRLELHVPDDDDDQDVTTDPRRARVDIDIEIDVDIDVDDEAITRPKITKPNPSTPKKKSGR